MLLPSKPQRSVTYAEQTHSGEHIRYAACAIVTPGVAELVGRDPASRDTSDQIDALRDDECVASVQAWLATARRSGLSIDALISGVPGRTLP
jgi:hypothetical protein